MDEITLYHSGVNPCTELGVFDIVILYEKAKIIQCFGKTQGDTFMIERSRAQTMRDNSSITEPARHFDIKKKSSLDLLFWFTPLGVKVNSLLLG
jgi:hypothetical protein